MLNLSRGTRVHLYSDSYHDMIYLPSLGFSITHMRLMSLCGEDVMLISRLAPYPILGLDSSGWTNSTLLVTSVSKDELELT